MKHKDMPYHLMRFPSPILRKKAKSVGTITELIKEHFKNMVWSMRQHQGIGLAAQQVGLDLQLAVVDAGNGLLKMADPLIIDKEGIDVMEEGCLSLPSTSVKVKRAKIVTVEYTDDFGKRIKRKFDGMTAKAIQHELDHLNGQLIIDYLPWYKKIGAVRMLKKV